MCGLAYFACECVHVEAYMHTCEWSQMSGWYKSVYTVCILYSLYNRIICTPVYCTACIIECNVNAVD